MIIGVTDENVATVDEWYQRAQPKYPIAILENGEFEQALGVKFFPTGAVLNPEGQILFSGSARETSSPLKEAMSDGLKTPLFPKALSKVQEAMAEGELDKAWSAVCDLKEKGSKDEEEGRWVARFSDTLATQAADALKAARSAEEMGVVYRAVELATPVAEAKTPFPVSEEAATWLAELAAAPGYADELKAGAQFQKAVEADKEREFTEAAKGFAKVASKFPDTRLAEVAQEKAEALVRDGWCGFDSKCADCKAGNRACKKCDESGKVKL